MKWRYLLLLCALAGSMLGQVSEPRLGCFSSDGDTYTIFGMAGSFVVRPADACEPVPSAWRIIDDGGEAWVERLDTASGAIEERRKLGAGAWGVFADGTVSEFGQLQLPGSVSGWSLVGDGWMLLKIETQRVLLNAHGRWFYLPGPVPAATELATAAVAHQPGDKR